MIAIIGGSGFFGLFEANAIQHTTFVPEVSIEEGIARTIQFEFIKPKHKQDEVLFYSE